ncbi:MULTISPECIES: RNA polymerase sigma factor [Sphingobacterium]|uniref:RNA polymerase sigma factor n=1 Tax=Sphingobacterium TaxID=28453 RepID=UPI00257EF990|nr:MULTISPECIES: RNA polymerase sigma-70 factor [Sphingobacterium]
MEGFYSETQAGAQDSVLIARIKKGDEEAFTIFYKRHFSKMYLAAVHLLKEEDMANDAVQELFMELWHRPERIDSTGNIKGYLYTVLRNRILSNMNRSKYFNEYVSSYLAFQHQNTCDTEETVLLRELERILEEKIALLPPKMQAVYQLSRDGKLSNKEIAEQLNITEGTVKQHKHQAMRILRSKFPRLLLFFLFFYNEDIF